MAAMYTDAREKVGCPKCGQPKGEDCRYPSGGRTMYPHGERLLALKGLPGYNLSDYQIIPSLQPDLFGGMK